MKFLMCDLETRETFIWTLEELLTEVNRDRSEKWTDYDETDWAEGWNEWCEGEFYSLIRQLED